jgi:hypothetical protein
MQAKIGEARVKIGRGFFVGRDFFVWSSRSGCPCPRSTRRVRGVTLTRLPDLARRRASIRCHVPVAILRESRFTDHITPGDQACRKTGPLGAVAPSRASRRLTFSSRMALHDLKLSTICSASTLGVVQQPALELVLPNFAIGAPALLTLPPTIRFARGRRQLAKAGVGPLWLCTDVLKGAFKRRQAEDEPGRCGERS